MLDQQQFAAYVGLDWGDRRHCVHLQVAGGRNMESFELEQKPEALHEWIARLLERFQGQPIAIAIEQRKGAVIHALMMYAFLVLFPINPKALARYREAFHVSGAKDDPTDSELLLDLLSKHSDRLRAWVPDSQLTQTADAMRATTKISEPSRRSEQSHYQPAETVFSSGSGLDRGCRFCSGLRFSGVLVHSRCHSERQPRPITNLLSPP